MRRIAARIAGTAVALAAVVLPHPPASAGPGPAVATLRAVVLADPAVSAENRALARRRDGRAGILPGRAQVGDVTGDGVPDLLVPLASGGPAGVVAWFLHARVDGRLTDVLAMNDSYRARVAIVGTQVVETVPVYARGDRDCCPGRERTTVYRWDGDRMEIASSRVAPAAPARGRVSPRRPPAGS